MASPQIQKIQFRPGIVKETTEYANTGGWSDCNYIRFRAGHPETIGGWAKLEPTAVIGVPRSLHQWSSLAGSVNIGIGTNSKYYILNTDTFYDITPQRATINLGTNPFRTVANAFQLQVTVPNHACQVGDWVYFSGATTGVGSYTAAQLNNVNNNNVLPGMIQFQVAGIVDGNTLLLTGTQNAGAAGQTGGGSAVVCHPDINAANVSAALPGGYGFGPFGGYYGSSDSRNTSWGQFVSGGTIRADGNTGQPTIWHKDNYGQDIVLNPRGGPIYYWAANSGSPSTGYQTRAVTLRQAAINAGIATPDTGIPANSNGVFVSPISQQIVAVGCTPLGSSSGIADPMQIRWSDIGPGSTQNGQYTWTPAQINSAGGQRLASGSYIVGFLPTFSTTLIWTDTTLYTMSYQAGYVFGFNVVASNISLISPQSAVTNGTSVFWMDTNSFRVYNGSVQELPCSVKSHVFSRINRQQQWKCFAAHNHNFSEIWFFYPVSNEVDNYVIYNYMDATWSVGTLNRTAWLDPGRIPTPYATDASGYIYKHENGTDADGLPLQPYIESADIDINGGDQFSFLQKVIPDVTFIGAAHDPFLTLQLLWRNTGGAPKLVQRSLAVTPTTDYVYGRIRGRRLSVRFTSSLIGCGWRLGDSEAEIMPNGRR